MGFVSWPLKLLHFRRGTTRNPEPCKSASRQSLWSTSEDRKLAPHSLREAPRYQHLTTQIHTLSGRTFSPRPPHGEPARAVPPDPPLARVGFVGCASVRCGVEQIRARRALSSPTRVGSLRISCRNRDEASGGACRGSQSVARLEEHLVEGTNLPLAGKHCLPASHRPRAGFLDPILDRQRARQAALIRAGKDSASGGRRGADAAHPGSRRHRNGTNLPTNEFGGGQEVELKRCARQIVDRSLEPPLAALATDAATLRRATRSQAPEGMGKPHHRASVLEELLTPPREPAAAGFPAGFG